jgi:hypothetical protein
MTQTYPLEWKPMRQSMHRGASSHNISKMAGTQLHSMYSRQSKGAEIHYGTPIKKC